MEIYTSRRELNTALTFLVLTQTLEIADEHTDDLFIYADLKAKTDRAARRKSTIKANARRAAKADSYLAKPVAEHKKAKLLREAHAENMYLRGKRAKAKDLAIDTDIRLFTKRSLRDDFLAASEIEAGLS